MEEKPVSSSSTKSSNSANVSLGTGTDRLGVYSVWFICLLLHPILLKTSHLLALISSSAQRTKETLPGLASTRDASRRLSCSLAAAAVFLLFFSRCSWKVDPSS